VVHFVIGKGKKVKEVYRVVQKSDTPVLILR